MFYSYQSHPYQHYNTVSDKDFPYSNPLVIRAATTRLGRQVHTNKSKYCSYHHNSSSPLQQSLVIRIRVLISDNNKGFIILSQKWTTNGKGVNPFRSRVPFDSGRFVISWVISSLLIFISKISSLNITGLCSVISWVISLIFFFIVKASTLRYPAKNWILRFLTWFSNFSYFSKLTKNLVQEIFRSLNSSQSYSFSSTTLRNSAHCLPAGMT